VRGLWWGAVFLLGACGGDPFTVGDGGSSPSDAGSKDSAGAACSDNGSFIASLDTGCTNTQSCSFGLHQIDCCGTKLAVGFNHAETNRFAQEEQAWEASCPQCGCPAGLTRAQDGKTGLASLVQVACVDFDGGVGVCQTFFP
jgi:hypothetical protein